MLNGEQSEAAPRNTTEAGFSLLETVVALVILAMALATLFQAYGTGMRAVSASSRHAEARLFAGSLLAEVSEPAKAGQQKGKRLGFNWQLQIKPATGDLSARGAKAKWRLYEVAATVQWAPRRRIVLRTLRLGAVK